MKKSSTIFLLLVFLFILVATDADAQRWTQRKEYASVGVNVGAMNYFGDIVPAPDFTSLRIKSTRPSVGVSYTYRFAPRLSFRGGLNWGRVTGSDAESASANEAENEGRFKRNLSFRNDIKELSGVLIVDLFENRSVYRRRPDFVPYGFVGLALFHHNPKAYYERGSHPGITAAQDIATGWYELQPLGTEGQYADAGTGEAYPKPYKRIQVAIPFGFGVRYKVDRNWDLSLEIGWRKTFTDYLDDASSAYALKADILNGGGSNPRAAAILSDRSAETRLGTIIGDPAGPSVPYKRLQGYGTPTENPFRGHNSDEDWYISTGISLNYILATRIRSPKFR
ncbi:DUF6089 family protein [Pontibacter arcticus]|uniref:DUF6089 domain-containing protein n=1 Tax=Pontibacter arcticus TaxID=2080288 RepID=A0A364RBG8_9BACT|nr:DUF6089 family protein [Pontibacter arcticus]RAU81587.1 hypothetical protein DP923_15590 [Pontibacter arcticus]